jgi:hypothetical protein
MKDKTLDGFITAIALFGAACFLLICGIGNAISYVAKKIWSPFDFYFVPHKETIIGKIIACRARTECVPSYPTDNDKIMSVGNPPLFVDRYFLIIKKGAKKVVRVLVPKNLYDEMSNQKGKMVSLLCEKCGAESEYKPVVNN